MSLAMGPDITPRAAMTDKGYDARTNRVACRARGIVPVIPYRANAKDRPTFFPRALYKARARIEQAVGKLKRFKRVAMRCEKTANSYSAIVAFACTMILVKSVHTAYSDTCTVAAVRGATVHPLASCPRPHADRPGSCRL
jgi:transposase